MRQWVRCYALTHRTYLNKIAGEYLKSKGIVLANWTKGVKEERCADTLSIFVLCLITGTHAFIHLKNNEYWTSLRDIPKMHLEFMQRYNLHVGFLGRGIYSGTHDENRISEL